MIKTSSSIASRNIKIISKGLVIALAGILALTVLIQSNPGINLPSRDYGIFSYIGQQILLGKLPYKDAWDHKPPAIFYFDALGLWLGQGLRWGIWVMEFISLITAIWFSYILMKKLWSVLPALFGTVIWLYGLNITLQGGNSTEEFPLLFHFLALFLFLPLAESPNNPLANLLVGLAFGVSFMFRANNAAVETAIVVTLIALQVRQRNFRTIFKQLVWMAIGALVPILGTAIYFWTQHLFNEMFSASILYNIAYSETKFAGAPAIVAGLRILGIVGWIGAAGYVIALILLIQQWRTEPTPILLLLVIGAPLAVSVSDPAQRNYGHYFINWLPFIALLGGLIIHTIQSRLIPNLQDKPTAEPILIGSALALTIIFFVASGQAIQYWKSFANVITRADVERISAISDYVENNTNPNDQVIFWGGFPGENLMALRASPTAYITYPLLLDSNLSEQFSGQFMRDLTENRPALIVDMEYTKALSLDPQKRASQLAAHFEWPYLPSNIDEVLKFINDNYHLEITFKNATVYRLNGTHYP